MKVKTQIINNQHASAQTGVRNQMKNYQQMLDTIVDLVFTKCIEVYEDIKNKASAAVLAEGDSGDASSVKGDAKVSVQRVSRLVATKVLELTGLKPITELSDPRTVRPTELSSQSDLNLEIEILNNVATYDKGYTSVDDLLIRYFIRYNGRSNILSGDKAIEQLNKHIGNCTKTTCRIINNAVPSDTKAQIDSLVVCPTSSVCDGMGAFGSCIKPAGKKEYANMNFSISYPGSTDSYYGETNIKPNGSAVNINYGIKCGSLEIYNFIDIILDSQPIVLQANYVFKNLINRIIEIWKTNAEVTDVEQLWRILYRWK
jgi:hypothetical protein